MIKKIIKLCDDRQHVTLTSYVHDDISNPRITVVVCPGGGYWETCVDREGDPIAEYYYNAGMNAFILDYSTASKCSITNLEPIVEVALAIKYVRENAADLGVASDKIVTCGFSAGGHLAGSAGILWDIPEVMQALGDSPKGINRPDGMILSYPVITAFEYAHCGSFINLTGNENYGEETKSKLSLNKNIDSTTPPIFIWHTATDDCVPVENSILIISECAKNHVPFEAHIYPYGPHGMSLATKEVCGENLDLHVATWAELSVMWLKDMFK